MKFAVLATVLAAATTVSSAAPSHEFSARSPGYSVKWRPGCQIWQFMICGLKAKRDAETPGGASAAAEYYSNIVKTVQHSKNLYNSGKEPTDLTGNGYTHEAFLYDFYGGEGEAPEGAKHNASSTPGCVTLGLCDI